MYNTYTSTSIAVIQWLFKAVNGTIKFINKVLERRENLKFSRFRDSKLFFWTIEILAVVAILFVLLQMKYIFSPIGIIVSTLFMPILVAGFLFYLFNPLVLFLEKEKYLDF